MIQELINKYGEDNTRIYLRERWAKPEHFFEYTSVYSGLFTDATPEVHKTIVAEYLKGGKVGVGLPRGGAKSTLTNLEYVPWCALYGRYKFIIIISDTFAQAKLHVNAIKNELENNAIIKWIYGDVKGGKWGEEGIEVKTTTGELCYIVPLGAGMKIRGLIFNGLRPQLVIWDDIENLEMVYSKERRQKLYEWATKDVEPALDVRHKNIFYIGTILHYHSLLKQVMDHKGVFKGWRTVFIKAIQDGKSFWEARYPLAHLVRMRDDPDYHSYVGSAVFAQEYQNEPQDDKDRIIKSDWVKEYSLAEVIRAQNADNDTDRLWKWLQPMERYAAIDPAISEKTTADYFAMYVAAKDPKTGNEYQLDLIHDRSSDPDKQVKWAADKVEEWRLQTLGVEAVQYQAGLAVLIKRELQRRGLNCRVVAIKTDKDKIRRARIHSVAFEGGFIHIRTDHPKYGIIRGEIDQFPLGEHDDAFDALMLSRELTNKRTARVFARNPIR